VAGADAADAGAGCWCCYRRMVARQQAALRLGATDTTELLSNHLLNMVLSDVADELDKVVGGTVDRVVAGELKAV
jgi:hypothetical protein